MRIEAMIKWLFRLWHTSKLEAQKKIDDRKNRCRHQHIVFNGHSDVYVRCLGPKGHKGPHSGEYTKFIDIMDFTDSITNRMVWASKNSALADGRFDD